MRDLLVLCTQLYNFIKHGWENECLTPSLFLPQTGFKYTVIQIGQSSDAIPWNPITATKET